jgi:hypothetical protein
MPNSMYLKTNELVVLDAVFIVELFNICRAILQLTNDFDSDILEE